MKRLKWVLIPVAVLVALTGLLHALGAAAPREHTATVRASLPPPPLAVWSAITDVERFPVWRPGVDAVTHAAVDGEVALHVGATWQETGEWGTMTYRVDDWQPPTRMVLSIVETDLGFGGTWTYLLEPAGSGCTLTLTERGWVDGVLMRAVARYLMGTHRSMEEYVEALGAFMSVPVKAEVVP